jgi:hypothetical protein
LTYIHLCDYNREFKKVFQKLLDAPSVSDLPFICYMASGAAGGALGAMVSGPLDCIKTRLQVQHSGTGFGEYKGIGDAFRSIVREEGAGAFTKGLGARIVWIAPGTAITIALYEEFKHVFTNIEERRAARTVESST